METFELILSTILPLATIAAIYVAYYFYVKAMIKSYIIDGISKAEQLEMLNEERFAYVVDSVLSIIPITLKPLFGRRTIEILVQAIFDSIKAYAITREISDK